MSKKLLKETQILNDCALSMNSKGMDYPAENVPTIFDTLVVGMARFLAMIKNKSVGSCAVAMRDLKGNFLMAAIARYFPASEEGMPGNWTMELTFDEEDIKDVNDVKDGGSLPFHTALDKVLYDTHKAHFANEGIVYDTTTLAVQSLINWLDKNASETEVVEVEYPGYFVASVAVEKGKKVFSIVPDGSVTRFVKDDLGESIAA